MENIYNLIELITNCISRVIDIRKDFLITLSIAIFFSILFWLIASNYTKLWNKRYKKRLIHYILFFFAGISTFLSVFIFSGLKYAEDAANFFVEKWSIEIRADTAWSNQIFKEAYSAVIGLGEEDLNNYSKDVQEGRKIPLSLDSSKEKCGEVYSKAVYRNFKKNNPLLSRIIWTDSLSPIKKIKASMKEFFKVNKDEDYDNEKIIDIATNNIKAGLKEKTPNAVFISRFILISMFLLLQFLAFGKVGFDAYKDLKLLV